MVYLSSLEMYLIYRAGAFPSPIIYNMDGIKDANGNPIGESEHRKARILKKKGYAKIAKRNAMGSESETHREVSLTYRGLGYADRLILIKPLSPTS